MKGLKTTLATVIAVGLLAGSAVGVAAQGEEAAAAGPVEFEAKWAFGPDLRSETSEAVDGVRHYRNGAWRPGVVLAATDPRFQGTLTIATNRDDYGAMDGPHVFHGLFRVANDEGAWQQRPALSFNFPDGKAAPTVIVFDGEGGYAGLTALVANAPIPDVGLWQLRGYIFEGDLPPAAELPAE